MKKIFYLILIFCTFSFVSISQSNSKKKESSSESSRTPNFGIGFRIGDPSGLTLKKYFGTNAIELSVGRSRVTPNRTYYDRDFDKWYSDKNFGYKEFQYIGYKRTVPLGVQLHYLIQKPIASSGLHWYYGFGGQVRFQQYYYDYRYKREGSSDWFYGEGERITDLDLGVDAVVGLEYIFKKIPVSLFGDGTVFMEIVDDPFLFWFQGAFGARFNF